ncbi:type IV secretion system protein [Hafnia paralvei]|jgi:type IV secretion system protein VirB8|uniref:virB8 family protein n=1 Tax=Hafnia paralvei TaxID=546367 RepID=UPI002FDC6B6B
MDLHKYFKRSKEISLEKPAEKKIEQDSTKRVTDAVKVFESNIINDKDKTIRLFRNTTIFLGCCTIALAIGIAGLAPLKSVKPFLLRVDNATGAVDVLEPYDQKNSTYEEIETRYWLARLVENREGYEWNAIQTMYQTVELMSNNAVFSEYKNYILGEYSPVKKLGKSQKMQVKVNAITLLDNETAQIRFTKAITELDGSPAQGYTPAKWIATVKFDFKKKIKTEEQRLVNPLGFEAISYRVDPEVIK